MGTAEKNRRIHTLFFCAIRQIFMRSPLRAINPLSAINLCDARELVSLLIS